MERALRLFGPALGLAATFFLAACGPAAEEPSPGGAAPTPAQPEEPAAPDTAALIARAAARWEAISHDDWIQAYDFVPPQIRDAVPLASFLQDKDNHRMRSPSAPELLDVEAPRAFVAVDYDWTPLHPVLQTADNLPPEGLTDRLHTVETWLEVDGEWFFEKNERRTDFDQRRR